MAVQCCSKNVTVTKQGSFIFAPQNDNADYRLQGFCFHKCSFIYTVSCSCHLKLSYKGNISSALQSIPDSVFFLFFLKLFPKSSLYLSMTLLLLKRLEKHTTKLMVLLKANIGRDSGVSSHATGKTAYDGGLIQAFKSVLGPNFIASAY